MVNKTLVFVLLAIVLAYGVFEARPLLSGPSVTIDSPTDGQTVASGVVTISGTALRTVSLTLDGAPLVTDQSGYFSTTLAFPAGTTILTWSARDRFGRTITKTRTIFVPTN